MKVKVWAVFLLSMAGIAAGSSFPPLVAEMENLHDVELLLNFHRSAAISSVAFASDGKTLASASEDHIVRLWNVTSGELIQTLEGDGDWIRSVAFSPDGKTLASAAEDGTVRLWNVASGEIIQRLEGHSSSVLSVAFSPDGKTLASASEDGTVRLWSIASGETIQRLQGHGDWVRSVAFSPDGGTLASASDDRTVRLWNVPSGDSIRSLEGHDYGFRSVAFSPDGKTLALASYDHIVRLWTFASGEEIQNLEGHDDQVRSVVFSPDGKILASASDDRTVRLWNVGSGEILRHLTGHDGEVRTVAFSLDGKTLASASSDRTVRLWNMASGETIQRLEGHYSLVSSVAFSPDSTTLATASIDHTVRLWNVSSGETVQRLEGHGDGVRSVAFSPDGETLASGSADRTVRLWNVSSGEPIRRLEGHGSSVRAVAFSPDGKTLASASSDRTLRLWNVALGETIQRLEGHDQEVLSLAFSPDGETLASGSADRTVRLWNTASGEEIQSLEGHHSLVLSVAFSPDGKTLASGSADRTVRLWNFGSGEIIRRLEGHDDDVLSVAFSPDGKILASGCSDRTVRLWNVASRETIRRLEGHDDGVLSVAFSPDGKILASSSTEIRLGFQRDGFSTSRILLGGKRGTWLSCHLDGTCQRHDDGTLVVRRKNDGSIEPVPPRVDPVPPQLEILDVPGAVETLDGQSTEVVLRIRNSGPERAFWIRILRVNEGPDDPLVVAFPPTRAILDPEEIAELPFRVSTNSAHDDPAPRTSALVFEVTSLFGEPLAVPPITVHGKVPVLSLTSVRWETSESPTFVAELINEGEQTLPPVRVDVVANAPGQPLPSVNHPASVDSGKTFQIALSAPDIPRDGSTHVTITVHQSEYPFHVWTFSEQPIDRAGSNALISSILASLLLVTTLLLGTAIAVFNHPLVRELSTEPSGLRALPPPELPRARRLLFLTRRLTSILARADVERVWLNGAIDFFADVNPSSRFRRFARRLALEPGATTTDEIQVLSLGPAFPLNVERCLVHQPPPGRPTTDVLNQLRQRPETRDQVTLILATDPGVQDEIHRRIAADRSHLLVAPSGMALTGLWLAPDPLSQLARIIASQVKLVRVSPYQTGGGVQKEAIFFGRDELLAHILSREPANYLVVGGRQLGKSSLLRAIERRAQDDPHLDVHYQVLSGNDLAGSLAVDIGIGRDAGIKRVLAELGKGEGRTLFLIDEADAFVRSEGSREVLAQLRGLSEKGRCHFVLAGFWELYGVSALDYHSPLRGFGETLYVGALEEDACRQLAIEPMVSMGLSYEPRELVDRVVQETGQRANLIAIACNEILKKLGPGERTITPEAVDAALVSWAIDSALEGWTQLATDVEDSRLDRIVVYTTIERDSFTRADVFEALKRHGVQTDPERVERSLKRLELAYVVERSGSTYTYPVLLFVQQVKRRGPKTLLAEELQFS